MNFRNFLARARGLVFIGMAAATLLGGQAVNAQVRMLGFAPMLVRSAVYRCLKAAAAI